MLLRPIRRLCLNKVRSIHSAHHPIYVSKSTDPYFNLALEEWLFRKAPPSKPTLLIYRDDPCVVIGRHQVPWKEVNATALRKNELKFVRRHSGGGTVYHDLGNTNFSIHTAREGFNRSRSAALVARAVRALGVPSVTVNCRNDIVVDGFKVSGSAYRIAGQRAYHHGTMLISTELGTLGDVLRVNKTGLKTRAIASVPSPVANLQRFTSTVTHNAFVKALVEEFQTEYLGGDLAEIITASKETESENEFLTNAESVLKTWEWEYGQTPEFTHTISRDFPFGEVSVTVHSKHGVITSCIVDSEQFSNVFDEIVGQRYGFIKVPEVSRQDEAEIWAWLRTEMEN